MGILRNQSIEHINLLKHVRGKHILEMALQYSESGACSLRSSNLAEKSMPFILYFYVTWYHLALSSCASSYTTVVYMTCLSLSLPTPFPHG